MPFANAGPLSAKLVEDATFEVYVDGPHGICRTQPDMVNRDLLAFIEEQPRAGTATGAH